MSSDALIATMIDRIVGRFEPSRVVLFGSQASGTANEWSDVDPLIVMPAALHPARCRRAVSR